MVTVYKCALCANAFTKSSARDAHETRSRTTGMCFGQRSTAHGRSLARRQFVCEFANCGRQFKDSDHLRRHATVHSDERPFHCDSLDDCAFTAKRQDHVAKHMKRKHPADVGHVGLQCAQCDYVGNLRYNMTQHVKLMHTVRACDWQFRCTIDGCAYVGKRRDTLARHTRRRHGVGLDDEEGDIAREDAPLVQDDVVADLDGVVVANPAQPPLAPSPIAIDRRDAQTRSDLESAAWFDSLFITTVNSKVRKTAKTRKSTKKIRKSDAYNCERCSFSTIYSSGWKYHLRSRQHVDGVGKPEDRPMTEGERKIIETYKTCIE